MSSKSRSADRSDVYRSYRKLTRISPRRLYKPAGCRIFVAHRQPVQASEQLSRDSRVLALPAIIVPGEDGSRGVRVDTRDLREISSAESDHHQAVVLPTVPSVEDDPPGM